MIESVILAVRETRPSLRNPLCKLFTRLAGHQRRPHFIPLIMLTLGNWTLVNLKQ